ncbi:MAG: PAS domain S-box protein [Halohasta sp.]
MSNDPPGVVEPTGGTDGPASPLHVACSISADRDRQRLVDWLDSRDRISASTTTPEGLLSLPFDCCVLDRAALLAVGVDLLERVDRERPLSLPCLLVADADAVDGSAAPETLQSLVTDVIDPPLQTDELGRRLEVLFRIRRQSRQLARSKAHHEELLELLPEAVVLVREGRIEYANTAADSLFRSEAEALVDERFLDSVAESSREAAADLVETARRTGSTEFVELELAVGDEAVTIEAAGTATEIGKGAVELVCRDMTDWNEREARLRLYRTAMDAATVGITITDATAEDNPLVYANRRFEELTGLEVDEMLGRNPRFVQSPRTDQRTIAEIRRAVDAGEPISVELINQHASGTEWYNGLDISPVHQDGELTHFLGFQRDVTAARTQQNELAVLDRVLRHNLRNRLNVIMGHAQTLGEGPGTEAVPLHASTICRTAEDLLSLSDKTRRFRAALDADAGTTARTDLVGIIDDCVDEITADDRAVFECQLPEQVPVQSGESVRFALRELLENAVDHSEQPEPEVHVTVEATDGEVTVEIVDDGPGIPASEQQAFDRETETATDHAIGIGLWLVRWAVDTANGTLGYAEADPHGSIVTLRLPAARDD